MLKHVRNLAFVLFAVNCVAILNANAMPDPCDPVLYYDTQCTSNCVYEPVAFQVCPDPTAFCNNYCNAGSLFSSAGSYCFTDTWLCGDLPEDDPPQRVHCECE